jgi:NADPH2:quinone reductase
MRAEDVIVCNPGHGEVRLRQEFIGVNYVDTMVRDGRFPVALPTVLGFEGAGTIDKVGSGVGRHVTGDRVGYFFSAGGYASERLIAADAVIRLPDDITTEQAATFLAKGLTAWMGLFALYQLQPGETVLVQGASGSVGSILARWARALGATVIGIAGSPDKLPLVEAGADHAFHAEDPSWPEKVRDIVPEGADVVYDFVGKATAAGSAAALRDGGTIVAIGAVSGQPDHDPAMLADRGIAVKSGGTPQYVTAATVDEASSALFEAIRRGVFADLDVVRYPIADARLVHEDIARRRLSGLPVMIA